MRFFYVDLIEICAYNLPILFPSKMIWTRNQSILLEVAKMNKKVVRLSFAVIVLMLASCSPVSQALVTPANPDLAPASTPTFTPPPASTPTFTPPPADTPTAKPLPTDTLTPTSPSSQSGHYKPFSYSKVSEGRSYEDPEVNISGVVCSLEQPFTLTDLKQPVSTIDSGRVSGVYQFTPSNPMAGSVSMAGLKNGFLPYNADGSYTVEDSKSDATILEGNLRLKITTQACPQMTGQQCFPEDYLIDLTPVDTGKCNQP